MSSMTTFDSAFSFSKSLPILLGLCEHLPYVLPEVSQAVLRSDFSFLTSYKLVYSSCLSARTISDTRQVLALFQKNIALPLNVDRKKVAFEAFTRSEEACKETNRRIRGRSIPENGVDDGLLYELSQKIASIIGPCPDLADLDFGFGPGASVGVSRLTSCRRKLSTAPTCTAAAWKYLTVLQDRSPHWDFLLKAVPNDWGRLTSVPKTALTDRCIVVEPLVNTYLQKGVGGYLRSKLKRAGCNLSSQSRNQHLAREGSITGNLATVDLSSASDTISRELVKEILPVDWWILLDDLRTHSVKMDQDVIHLEKFSSMGNGFTFELESLIFYALAKVVSARGSVVSVYGDDIIIETKHIGPLVDALAQLGFTVNDRKSYWTGVFRESCGKDYFGGVDVRPCYVKAELSVKELFRIHNFFVRNGREDVSSFVRSRIPKGMRVFGPDGFGDGVLVSLTVPIPPFKRKLGWGGRIFKTYVKKPNVQLDPLRGDLAAILYSLEKSRREPFLFDFDEAGNILTNANGHARCTISESNPFQLYTERGGFGYSLKRVYSLR